MARDPNGVHPARSGRARRTGAASRLLQLDPDQCRVTNDVQLPYLEDAHDRVSGPDGARAKNSPELSLQELTLWLTSRGTARGIRRGTYQLDAQGPNHIDEDALPSDGIRPHRGQGFTGCDLCLHLLTPNKEEYDGHSRVTNSASEHRSVHSL